MHTDNASSGRDGPTRRQFIKKAGTLMGVSMLGSGFSTVHSNANVSADSGMPTKIQRVDSTFEREPLAEPFGFAGGHLTNLWQSVALMESHSGTAHVGLGTQSVLWADSSVFASHSESGGNALMYALTEHALQRAEGRSFRTPIDLLEQLYEDTYEYARALTGEENLRKTFVLNALVPVDNAAWLLYAGEAGVDDFDELIPDAYDAGLSHRHDTVASIPTFGYEAPVDALVEAVEEGYYFLKIKIGHPGSQEEMLERDKERLSAIHDALGHKRTEYTESGELPYYLDANGRYEHIDTLKRLLDHADDIGALDQIAIVEEPFPEDYETDVGGLGVRVAADESASTAEDARRMLQRGYGALALKPVAKTLSMTMKIAQVAYEHDAPCFCADLTVNPILVDWNKSVAARLPSFPGFKTGLMETNGHQFYANWERMQGYHPCPSAPWLDAQGGAFHLGEAFYERDGCIFETPEHYRRLLGPTGD